MSVHQANGQRSVQLSGNVVTSDGKPLSFVTVSLLNAADSALIKVAISADGGDFLFEAIPVQSYILRLTSVGYESLDRPLDATVLNQPKYNIGKLVMEKMLQQLTNHVVMAKKPMIEVKADKMVFNVESSVNATGSDAFELLRKSPGVQVDNNDNILMKGKSGVRIYIDGKPTQFDAKELAAYLKGINSSDIEAIEMIANPSAKFDASGNSGIINIRLKKNKKFGTNGNVSVGFVEGITPKLNESLSLNYRNKKFNVFGNFGHNFGINRNDMNLSRTQLDTLYDLKSVNKHDNQHFNAKLGADYFLNSRSTIGFITTHNATDGKETAFGNTPIYYAPTGTYIKTLVANSSGTGKNRNDNRNLNYRYADTSGTEVNVDADYGIFSGRGAAYQPNFYNDANGQLLYKVVNRNNTPINIHIYTIKTDVSHKWGKKSTIGYGGKLSWVKTDNTFDFYTEDANGIPVRMLNRSNSFTYKENVNALYTNFQRLFNKKWSVQAGLRMEQTHSNGVLTRADGIIQADNEVSKSYVSLFPSGALTYNLNDNNTFNLTYSRRIDRPSYQDLNPFENKLDELTYQKGNAFLRPQFSNNLECSHTFKGALTTTLSYGHVRDFATEITDTVGNATYVQQKNLASMNNYGISVGSATPFAKWWSGYISLWYNYNLIDGLINSKKVSEKIPGYGAYWQQSFSLKKEFTLECSGWYSGPSFWGATWKTRPQWQMDLGVQKTLFNKNLTVKLAATDIFYTAPWTAKNDFGGLKVDGGGNWESRTFRVNISWRFGSAQIKAARERQTGLESESKRIKGAQ